VAGLTCSSKLHCALCPMSWSSAWTSRRSGRATGRSRQRACVLRVWQCRRTTFASHCAFLRRSLFHANVTDLAARLKVQSGPAVWMHPLWGRRTRCLRKVASMGLPTRRNGTRDASWPCSRHRTPAQCEPGQRRGGLWIDSIFEIDWTTGLSQLLPRATSLPTKIRSQRPDPPMRPGVCVALYTSVSRPTRAMSGQKPSIFSG